MIVITDVYASFRAGRMACGTSRTVIGGCCQTAFMMSNSSWVSITPTPQVRSFHAHLLCLERAMEQNGHEKSAAGVAFALRSYRQRGRRDPPLLPARLLSLDRRRTFPWRACDAGSRGSTLKRDPDALGPFGTWGQPPRPLIFSCSFVGVFRSAGVNVSFSDPDESIGAQFGEVFSDFSRNRLLPELVEDVLLS